MFDFNFIVFYSYIVNDFSFLFVNADLIREASNVRPIFFLSLDTHSLSSGRRARLQLVAFHGENSSSKRIHSPLFLSHCRYRVQYTISNKSIWSIVCCLLLARRKKTVSRRIMDEKTMTDFWSTCHVIVPTSSFHFFVEASSYIRNLM